MLHRLRQDILLRSAVFADRTICPQAVCGQVVRPTTGVCKHYPSKVGCIIDRYFQYCTDRGILLGSPQGHNLRLSNADDVFSSIPAWVETALPPEITDPVGNNFTAHLTAAITASTFDSCAVTNCKAEFEAGYSPSQPALGDLVFSDISGAAKVCLGYSVHCIVGMMNAVLHGVSFPSLGETPYHVARNLLECVATLNGGLCGCDLGYTVPVVVCQQKRQSGKGDVPVCNQYQPFNVCPVKPFSQVFSDQ